MSVPEFFPSDVLRNCDMENKLYGLRTDFIAFEIEDIFFLIVKDGVAFGIYEI